MPGPAQSARSRRCKLRGTSGDAALAVTAAEIAAALGGAHRSSGWWRCRCPVHQSRGATLALRDGGRALIVKCFAGCSRRDVLAELGRLGLTGDATNDLGRPFSFARHTDRDDAARRVAAARTIWNAATGARGTPLVAYLAARGITISPPCSLRYAAALWRRDGTRGPAIVARIDDIGGELIGISRTWLGRGPDGQWRRDVRAMLGRAAGGAVRLAPATETLLIGEGVETCLAAMQATAQPAWAALSTSGLVALVLPLIVRAVVILADHDVSGAGERAARSAAERWIADGRRVRLAMPPKPGTDLADVLLGRSNAWITQARNVAA
jgi:putative DNA primase/helicase